VRVGRRLDWEPRDAESAALERVEEEVEKRALVRFTVFTALRERRVTPRDVSIVLESDDNDRTGKCVDMRWRCQKEISSEHCDTNLYSDTDSTPTTPGLANQGWSLAGPCGDTVLYWQ
jgi:hypothetical protein